MEYSSLGIGQLGHLGGERIKKGQIESEQILNGRVEDGEEADFAVPGCHVLLHVQLLVVVDDAEARQNGDQAQRVEEPVQAHFGLVGHAHEQRALFGEDQDCLEHETNILKYISGN